MVGLLRHAMRGANRNVRAGKYADKATRSSIGMVSNNQLRIKLPRRPSRINIIPARAYCLDIHHSRHPDVVEDSLRDVARRVGVEI